MWNKADQTLPREELAKRQLNRLQSQVTRLYRDVPFYQERFDAAGVKPSDVTCMADLARFSFVAKTDLRETFPWGLLAVDPSEIVETHMSSGTTGKPVVATYTRADMALWAEVMARTLDMGGVGPGDIVQNGFGYGLFTGGFGVHYGAQQLGAMVLPISSGNTHRQVQTIADFGSSVLTCTPSYALYIAEYARDHGFEPASLGLKAGFFGAEPWSDSMRTQIEQQLFIKAYDIYGLTELIGPGVGAECSEQDGLHIFEDHFYPEIVNPDTGEPLPDGEKGELILTSLTRQSSPVLRYRTRDITYLIDEPCPCGRTSRRMHRLMGRTDDMLIIRGVNLFPAQVEDVLLRVQGVEPHYRLIVDREGTMDSLDVEVEMTEGLFSDDMGDVLQLERRLEAEVKAALGIQARCILVSPKSIQRSEGKAKRIIDRREVVPHV